MTTDTTHLNRGERAPFAVVCADCEVSKELDDANETVAFYRRHHSVTGHDVEWVRADLDVSSGLPNGDIGAVIAELENRVEDGVPIGVVAAAMGERGQTIGETLAAIRELRMAGELYEPRDDHLRVT
ncbi:hypothetical protein [Halalkalicoccus salilacus]|uniref:hypothetical protein n=1 Tax=Halalkalicoccus salilacus TaxID=3117459 RepID=UPI00300E9065